MFTFHFIKALGNQLNDETRAPFVVSITDAMRYTDHVAAGSILNNRFVLTNARPFSTSFNLPSDFKIVGNIPRTWDRSVDIYSVERIFVHPNYVEATSENDVALLQTSTAINFHDRVQPIALSEVVLANQVAVISGYGFTGEYSRMYAPLINVDFRAISNEECRSILGTANAALVFESKACVLPIDDRVICNNDNGAPLTVNGQVIALSSWNVPCAHNSPIVVERITAHLDFIREVLNRNA